jgi:tetratricopeptide (TPR) repeat protein
MKAEHRHELKTNVLAEWIANFPQWAKENLKTIIYVSVLVVVVAGLYFWKMYEEKVVSVRKQLWLTKLIAQLPRGKIRILQAQAKGVDISYMLIQTADDLQIAAQNAKDDQMAALAQIKRAEALRMELHYRFGAVGERDAAAQIDLARASYAEAVKKSSTSPLLMSTAKLGLGLCEEELGNFEKARQIYGEIIADASFEGTVAAAQARLRLETMTDYQRKVVFKPSLKPSPAEPELLQPQIQLSPIDVNLRSQTPNSMFGDLPPSQ